MSLRKSVVVLVAMAILPAAALTAWFLRGGSRARAGGAVVAISARLPGADAATIEAEVAEPMEVVLGRRSEVRELRSTSKQGQVEISVGFAPGVSDEVAVDRVREAVTSALASLPRELEPPVIQRLGDGPSVAALSIVVDAGDRARNHAIVDGPLREALLPIVGVQQLRVHGDAEPQVIVRVDPRAAANRGLGVDVIASSLRTRYSAPFGALANEPPETVEAIAQGFLTDASDQVKLSDVATVALEYSNPDLALVQRRPVVVVDVIVSPGARDDEALRRIGAAVEEVARASPPDSVRILYAADQSGVHGDEPLAWRLDVFTSAGATLEQRAEAVTRLLGHLEELGLPREAYAAVDGQGDHPDFVRAFVSRRASSQRLRWQLMHAGTDAPGTAFDLVPECVGRCEQTRRLRVHVSGPDLDQLTTIANEVGAKAQVERGRSVHSVFVGDAAGRRPELQVKVDSARAARLGLEADRVARLAALVIAGERVGYTGSGRLRVPIELRVGVQDEAPAEVLHALSLRANLELVPVAQAISLHQSEAPVEITRRNGRRSVEVVALVGDSDEEEAEARTAIRRAIAQMKIPAGVMVELE